MVKMVVFWALQRERVLWTLLSDDSNKSMNLFTCKPKPLNANPFIHHQREHITQCKWIDIMKKMFYVGVLVHYNSNLVITSQTEEGWYEFSANCCFESLSAEDQCMKKKKPFSHVQEYKSYSHSLPLFL